MFQETESNKANDQSYLSKFIILDKIVMNHIKWNNCAIFLLENFTKEEDDTLATWVYLSNSVVKKLSIKELKSWEQLKR